MARSGAVSALLILITVLAGTPAEAQQRGGVVDVMPPEEVERIIGEGSCISTDGVYADTDPRTQPTRRGQYRGPHIPDSIAMYWGGEVAVLLLYDVSADGAVMNGRIAQYAYQGRTRHFTRGQLRALEPELLAWLALPSFEGWGDLLPVSGCRTTLTIRMD